MSDDATTRREMLKAIAAAAGAAGIASPAIAQVSATQPTTAPTSAPATTQGADPITVADVAAADKIARPLGIEEVHAELLPEQKIERVKELRRDAPLAMVGDGVNDAPALAASDIGIAMGGQSSDTAMETADVVLMTPDLSKVPYLLHLSRRCRRLLKQNITFALGSKLVVMGLAAAGLATMWMAVAADVGASLIVVANGMRMIERSEIK